MSIRSKLKEYWDVLKLTSKPDRKEFMFILKISLIGILLVGVIAFAVQTLLGTIVAHSIAVG
ncbi:protein translocase SEC61 complex subunit gamma [Candidatus Marsarchaeota G2 archaeon BE_D]|jgi:protein translocase SEC61 complex gamma subunit|uniref:Protein translocase subunit SecE n=1 Tax=Candidatus Marsarchaeota G2 archaeon BE_D TaxID=1978158 RepID=A0A2R6C5K7_9ARCH|nr:MAG: protein translocase SEC61 complex subunit gamma [Candidatus Marsarchaeota G2 archaeon BE_D]